MWVKVSIDQSKNFFLDLFLIEEIWLDQEREQVKINPRYLYEYTRSRRQLEM